MSMGLPLRRYFEGLLLLLLATGFATLAITGQLPWLVVAPVTAAFIARGYCYGRRIEARVPARWVVTALLLYLPIFVLDGLVLSGDFMAATLHWVVIAGAAQMFSASSKRDYLTLGLLAVLEVLAAALLTVSGAFFLLFVVFLAVLIATLVAHEMMQTQERAAAPPSNRQRHSPLRPLLRFSLLLSAGVAVFSMVIFFLLPRLTTAAWASRPQDALSGFSDEVQLGAVANLQRSNAVVMHVRITSADPAVDPAAFQQIPWRGRGLTRFDGQRWYAPESPTLYRTDAGQLTVGLAPAQPPARIVQYHVTLEPVGSPVLFFPPRLLRAETRFPVLAWDRATETLSSPGLGFAGVSYSGISDVAPPSTGTLRASPPVDTARLRGSLADDLQLPDSLDPRIPALARRITEHAAPNNWDRMQALSQYLQTHYQYTLENLPQGSDPLATFLFDQPQGDCEYFASALAVMARTLNIPTRVVNGFVLGSYNPLTKEYMVEGSDAHAWVEAYFPEPDTFRRFRRGRWVTFDATPAGDGSESSLFPGPAMIMDALSSVWQEWIVNYDWVQQVHLARLLQDGMGTGAGLAGAAAAAAATAQSLWSGEGSGRNLWLGVGTGLMVLLLIGGVAYARGWRPRLTRAALAPEPEARRRARRAYRQLQRYWRRAGFRRHPAQTADEFAGAIAAGQANAGLAAHTAEFARLYQSVMFGPGGAAAATDLRRQLRLVRRGLGWRAYGWSWRARRAGR